MTEQLVHLETADAGGRRVARVVGEVDLSNAAHLGRELHAVVAGAPAVVVDLTAIAYLDSQGVRILHGLAYDLKDDGVDVAFVAPADSVAGQVLAVTRLADVAPVRESVEG